eukprot:CAMPEP_0117698624 /NCGR_PEP_ID=MMETSP0804-20121206/29855_1 /TAXON_ID=1074897 /ORGANISM="Tetraselmis astigmatica, Strain CCMP880" /LENGTH=404 /DNA_ID=CAMNT_0005512941 /DNA_START=128 /DNA_END=1343 /DNA_ORIENTATION=+
MAWLDDALWPEHISGFGGDLDVQSSHGEDTTCYGSPSTSIELAAAGAILDVDYFKDICSGTSSHDATSGLLEDGNDSNDEKLWANEVSCLPDILDLGSADEPCFSTMESDMISVMGSSDEDLGMNFSGFSMEPMSGTRCSGPTSEVWGEVGSKNATGKRLTDVAEPTLSTSRPDLLIVPEIQELVGCQLPYATPQSRRSSTGSPTGMFPSLPAYSADFKPGTSVQFEIQELVGCQLPYATPQSRRSSTGSPTGMFPSLPAYSADFKPGTSVQFGETSLGTPKSMLCMRATALYPVDTALSLNDMALSLNTHQQTNKGSAKLAQPSTPAKGRPCHAMHPSKAGSRHASVAGQLALRCGVEDLTAQRLSAMPVECGTWKSNKRPHDKRVIVTYAQLLGREQLCTQT